MIRLMGQSCAYCGSPPSNYKPGKGRADGFTYSGIDRVDNSQGYTTANTVPCCKACNIAKNDREVEEFLAWATRVAEHSKKSKTRLGD